MAVRHDEAVFRLVVHLVQADATKAVHLDGAVLLRVVHRGGADASLGHRLFLAAGWWAGHHGAEVCPLADHPDAVDGSQVRRLFSEVYPLAVHRGAADAVVRRDRSGTGGLAGRHIQCVADEPGDRGHRNAVGGPGRKAAADAQVRYHPVEAAGSADPDHRIWVDEDSNRQCAADAAGHLRVRDAELA